MAEEKEETGLSEIDGTDECLHKDDKKIKKTVKRKKKGKGQGNEENSKSLDEDEELSELLDSKWIHSCVMHVH